MEQKNTEERRNGALYDVAADVEATAESMHVIYVPDSMGQVLDEIFSEYRREKDGYLRFSLIDSLGYESVSAVNRIVELIEQELPEFLPKSSELNQFVEDSCFNVAVQLDTDGVTIQS